jgi:hypothetical protein
MADDTKYKDVFSVILIDGRTQLFAIDRDLKLWTMFMTMNLPVAQWTDWELFPLPGGNPVIKITSSPGSLSKPPGIAPQYWFPRLWAIDYENDLWSCESISFPNSGTSKWKDWTPWVAPYPNN